MCGIAGYIGKEMIEQAVIHKTLQLMRNRGPDCQSHVNINNGQHNIYLLHSRLSIIDLNQRANQPFTIDDCTLIFNGEIYNYIELRKELEKQGHFFKTSSDTEVLLRYYLLYGDNCVDYFEGMWSFAVFDAQKGTLLLSRDRFAEKPLYYLKTESGIYFGSEVKFIKQLSNKKLTINQKQLLRYLINGYKSLYKTEETFYEEVQEVRYAVNMIIDSDLRCTCRRYWSPQYAPCKMTLQKAIEGTQHHLLESVRLRLRADVPLAFCLSGGVDSSALASIAAKKFNYNVATFTIIDKDERYNEYGNANATIKDLGCKHTFVELTYEKTLDKLKDLICYHDAPIATITYFVHSFLSEAISQNGYRVVFSGTSADELFTGYYDHFNLHLYEMRTNSNYQIFLADWEKYTGKFVRNPYLKNPELYFSDPTVRNHVYFNNDIFSSFLKRAFKESFTEENYCGSLLRNRMLNELFHEATPVILHEDDLNSMKYSIENRSPYLDSNLFRFAYSIPNELLINNGYGKYVLRQAVDGILNDTVRLDREKKGFNASITSIVDFSDKKTREYFLDNGPIFDLFDKNKIEQLIRTTPISNSYSKFLFNFINTKIFLEING